MSENITAFPVRNIDGIQLGFGPPVKTLESHLTNNYKFDWVTTNSGSASAFMIFSYLYKLYGKCNVYLPNISFTSVAWSAKQAGHRLVLVDCGLHDLSMSLSDLKTKASANSWKLKLHKGINVVMYLPYGGQYTCPDFTDCFGNNNYITIVDASHGIEHDGTADLVFGSFYSTKTIQAIQGGFIAVNPNSQVATGLSRKAVEWFETCRNFGRIDNGDSYDVVSDGFKFYMDSFNAQIAFNSLEKYEDNVLKRKKNYLYLKHLIDTAGIPNLILLRHNELSSFYLCTIVGEASFIKKISKLPYSTKHYPPLSTLSYYKHKGWFSRCPVSTAAFPRFANLPIHEHMTNKQLEQVVKDISQ